MRMYEELARQNARIVSLIEELTAQQRVIDEQTKQLDKVQECAAEGMLKNDITMLRTILEVVG